MGILQIRKAEREGSKLLFVFAAWTGKGKTYSAIQFGYGLAGFDPSKLGFVDAENRRGSLCADILEKASSHPTKDRFLIGDLYPPFSPARYSMAIDDFQAAGVEVLIIDSASHEWEGTGGCQDIAEEGNPKIPRWERAKREHKRWMQKMLQSDMHIICCVRAREKTKPEKRNGKTEFVDYGLQPIQEKNFMFEATASLMMHDEGLRQEIIKCPAALLNILGRKEGYITADDGKAVRDWVSGALKLDPTVEKYRNRLISNTEGGVAHIEECWKMTPDAVKQALGAAFHDTLVASAKGYEEQKQISLEDTGGRDEDAGNTPATADAEKTEAEAIAARARANGAAAPVTNAQQQTPAQQAATPAQKAAAATQGVELPPQGEPVVQPKRQATPPAEKKADPPKQQELAPAVKGVLPSDPVF